MQKNVIVIGPLMYTINKNELKMDQSLKYELKL